MDEIKGEVSEGAVTCDAIDWAAGSSRVVYTVYRATSEGWAAVEPQPVLRDHNGTPLADTACAV